MTAQQLGKYQILERLGAGGFGTVYKAVDNLGRTVAVKVLKPGWADDPDTIARFQREARAAGELFHSHIAAILDFDEVEGRRFLVMRYVNGSSLDNLLKVDGPLPWEKALNILDEVAQALDYAHRKGFIHRDIKPANILVSPEDGAVLTDFGLVKAAQSSGLSTSGVLLGTPNYIAPEVWRGEEVRPQTDLYSLACVCCEMLTGQALFAGDSAPQVMTRHILDGPQFPSTWPVGVPEGIEAVLSQALARQPEQRQASAAAFVQALAGLAVGSQSVAESAVQKPDELPAVSVENAAPESRETLPVIDLPSEAIPLQASAIAVEEQGGPEPGKHPPVTEETAPKKTDERTMPRVGTGKPPAESEGIVSPLSTASRKPIIWGLILMGILAAVVGGVWWAGQRQSPAGIASPTSTATGDPSIRLADGMTMVYIPAGKFRMGSSDEQIAQAKENCPNCNFSGEQPQHEVYLDAYWIDQTEVTNAMYALCVQAGVCQPPGQVRSPTRADYYANSQYASFPVIFVSWDDAQTYCGWAGGRLPTEAEWEKAARGYDGRVYPWGDAPPDCALLSYNKCQGDTTSAGSYLGGASPYGLLDISGNVWEWVQDWYAGDYYGGSPVENPVGPATGQFRVLRGGAWSSEIRHVRATYRLWQIPSGQYDHIGFRCAR